MASCETVSCEREAGTDCATLRLSSGLVAIFAAAAGLSVANIYYAQPLLDAIAGDFGIAPARIGLVVTLTQIGYALGLVFIVPLGDLVDRRRLVICQGIFSAIALVVIATARNDGVLFAGMMAMGLLAVVVQVLVAFAAGLAAAHERGRVVGLVTGGVVIGILAARFVAGTLADLGGWRAVYLVSAALTLAMTAVLFLLLPRTRQNPQAEGYLALLRSIPLLFLRDPVLLVRGLLALFTFAAFSIFWTAMVLPLSAAPFHFAHGVIGLFGLVGLAGALAAGSAGRLADRGLGQGTSGIALTVLLASWGLIALLPSSLVLFTLGVVLLDFAVQAVHVTNQSLIFARHPEARSRLVGGYMAFYSAGSALGAIAATTVYAAAGWSGVALLGAVVSVAGLLFWLVTLRVGARPPIQK